MSRKETYFEILSLMDKALVRGANHFTAENVAALRDSKSRWIEMGGTSDEIAIIDKFLAAASMARGAPEEHVAKLTARTMELKGEWRNIGAPD